MNSGQELFQVRNAPVFAPVFTALRRGELLRRDMECGVRPSLISVIANHRAPRHAPRFPGGIRIAGLRLHFHHHQVHGAGADPVENHPPVIRDTVKNQPARKIAHSP